MVPLSETHPACEHVRCATTQLPLEILSSGAYYDGHLEGIARCRSCPAEYLFRAHAWDVASGERVFSLEIAEGAHTTATRSRICWIVVGRHIDDRVELREPTPEIVAALARLQPDDGHPAALDDDLRTLLARGAAVLFAYPYIGPPEILAAATGQPIGTAIRSSKDLSAWLAANPDARSEGATYVVDTAGLLRLAPRRSEHVACAGREDVLAAGEMRFRSEPAPTVTMVSNQSTGYCPDVTCWEAVERALHRAGVPAPTRFTHTLVFRRCEHCAELNVVKDSWFACVFCNEALPREWNVSKRTVVNL